MSADLLAAFDSYYQAPQDDKKNASNTSAFNDLSSLTSSNQTTRNRHGANTSQWQAPQAKTDEDIWGNITSFQTTSTSQPTQTDNDIWGSFESIDNAAPTTHTNYVAPTPQYGTAQDKPRPVILRRDTLEMFSSRQVDGWGDFGTARNESNQPKASLATIPASAPPHKTSFGGDILFDADNLSAGEEEDEDFGDFEGANNEEHAQIPHSQTENTQPLEGFFGTNSIQSNPTKRPAQLSPISPNFDAGSMPYPQAPKSPSFQERNPFAELGVRTSQVSKLKSSTREASPVTPWPTFAPPQPQPYQDSPVPKAETEEEWGDFAETPADEPVSFTKPTSGIEADAWAWDAADGVISEKDAVPQESNEPPPTNIPPPSVLLPVFASQFDLPHSTLFQPVANQTFSLKNRILSDPATIEFLRAYLLLATVAAHIIAGRKLRWKRDKLLSQAMKIGPAAAGGKGGMKLAGVDKAEVTREDRETADAVRAWKDQLGRLKSAVAIANSSIQDVNSHLVIPEVSETLHVKHQEGSLTAPKQCIICGLKREERVSKVDLNVEDSFGEWWTEHWGHRSCRNFWLEHESKLRHR